MQLQGLNKLPTETGTFTVSVGNFHIEALHSVVMAKQWFIEAGN